MNDLKNRLVDFLQHDLKQIEENKNLMKFEEIENFVYYWQQHAEKLRPEI